MTQSRGDGNTNIGETDELIRPNSVISHVLALEGAMDSLNHLFAQTGMLSKINIGMIEGKSAGRTPRRFQQTKPMSYSI